MRERSLRQLLSRFAMCVALTLVAATGVHAGSIKYQLGANLGATLNPLTLGASANAAFPGLGEVGFDIEYDVFDEIDFGDVSLFDECFTIRNETFGDQLVNEVLCSLTGEITIEACLSLGVEASAEASLDLKVNSPTSGTLKGKFKTNIELQASAEIKKIQIGSFNLCDIDAIGDLICDEYSVDIPLLGPPKLTFEKMIPLSGIKPSDIGQTFTLPGIGLSLSAESSVELTATAFFAKGEYVPEPSSVVIWAMMSLTGTVVIRRRYSKTAKRGED